MAPKVAKAAPKSRAGSSTRVGGCGIFTTTGQGIVRSASGSSGANTSAASAKPKAKAKTAQRSVADLIDGLSHARDKPSSLTQRKACTELAHSLAVQLQEGGTEVGDEVYERGALPALLSCLEDLETADVQSLVADPSYGNLSKEVAGALWLLLNDSDRCFQLVSMGGNRIMLKIVAIAASAQHGTCEFTFGSIVVPLIRALSLSLYSESRHSLLWQEESWAFLPPALKLALSTMPQSGDVAAASAFCDLAALRLQRSCHVGVAEEFLDVMPCLLDCLVASLDDPELVQHACRLTAFLAKRAELKWPLELIDKTGPLIATIYSRHSVPGGPTDVIEFARKALESLSRRREAILADQAEKQC